MLDGARKLYIVGDCGASMGEDGGDYGYIGGKSDAFLVGGFFFFLLFLNSLVLLNHNFMSNKLPNKNP